MNKTLNVPSAAAVAGAARGSATLELTLKRRWFDMIVAGEKKEEYRAPSDWILSRLHGKQYSRVRFRNGYAKTSPVVVCEYLGWETGRGKLEWGAGFDIVIIIKLGRVIEPSNEKS